MSFNRATMIPCKDCCRPATYTFQHQDWLQDITGTSYLLDPYKGIYSNSISLSYSNVIFQVPIAADCSGASPTFFDSNPQTHSATGSSQVVSDPTTPQEPVYRTSCQETDNCTDPPCDTSGDWGCDASGAEEYSVSCISYTAFGGSGGSTTDVASTTIPSAGYIQSNASSQVGNVIVDTDWYASGVKIKGTPETFVGYPVTVDGCHAYRKGLRKIWAKMGAGSGIHHLLYVRWFVAKEWEEGEQNKIYTDTLIAGNTNQLQEFFDGLQLNVDVGIQAGGEGSTTLFASIRLGDGEGDGSFGEGSGWYDITDTEVEFAYRKANTCSLTLKLAPDYHGTSFEYCCDSFNCGCTAYWKFRSDYVQILTSDDVVDPDTGECIWDAGAGGDNFTNFTEESTSGIICKAGAALSVS